MELNAVTQNILATFATVLYTVVLISSCDFLVSKGVFSSKVSRKVVHVGGGSLIMFWNLFRDDHWTWMLNDLVPFGYMILLFVKGAILRDPNDVDVPIMTRTGDPVELLYGPLNFTMVMNAVHLVLYKQPLGVAIMAYLGYGDGVAPLAGTYFPLGAYRTFPFGSKDKKTLSGSLAFFISSLLGYRLLSWVISLPGDPVVNWDRVWQLAALATVTDALTGQFDNIFIPMVVYFAYDKV